MADQPYVNGTLRERLGYVGKMLDEVREQQKEDSKTLADLSIRVALIEQSIEGIHPAMDRKQVAGVGGSVAAALVALWEFLQWLGRTP